MNKFVPFLLIGFAWLLYMLSAITFTSYLYSFTIKDTVSAIESAFGTLVILIFLLILAKRCREKGRAMLNPEADTEENENDAPKS